MVFREPNKPGFFQVVKQQVPFPAGGVATVQDGKELNRISNSPDDQSAAFQAIREAVIERRIERRRRGIEQVRT